MPRTNLNQMTNVEFLTHMMEFSKHGALMQAFILQACEKYAKACAKASPADFESQWLSGDAWHGCAVELRDALEEKHKRL